MEIWKDIPGYEGLYQASNLGNIKSLNYNKTGLCQILKPSKYIYNNVSLTKNKKCNTFKLHRLVAQSFILNPDNKPEVNHIDGNKFNNYIENLEWVTRSENILHSIKILGNKCGGHTGKLGAKNHNAKKVNQYDLDGNFIKTWDCVKEAGITLGVNPNLIGQVCNGKRKTTGGFKFQY